MVGNLGTHGRNRYAREICPAPPAKNGPPDRRRRIFLAEGAQIGPGQMGSFCTAPFLPAKNAPRRRRTFLPGQKWPALLPGQKWPARPPKAHFSRRRRIFARQRRKFGHMSAKKLIILFPANPTISIFRKLLIFFSVCEARSKIASKKRRATKLTFFGS